MRAFCTEMRAFCSCLVLILLVTGGAHADQRVMKPEARVRYERGLKLYRHHQYDEAIGELRAALAIDPQPDLLYALGQAERRRGHCDRAIEYYESCLGLVKDAAAAAALRVQIERCKVEQGDPKKEPPAPVPAAPTAPGSAAPGTSTAPSPPLTPVPELSDDAPAVLPESHPAPRPPAPPAAAAARWYRDALGLSLVGVGLAGGAAGGALAGIAHARLDAAGDSYQKYADARSAPTLWTAGIVTVSVSGALIVAGAVRLAVVGARGRR
jgi:tetratricopeptide (TPR) repeat protein